MKSKFLLCFALVLGAILAGCSTVAQQDPCKAVISALDKGDWVTLRKLAKPGMLANRSIDGWENSSRSGHAVCVGKLIQVEKNPEPPIAGKPYTKYSFLLMNKDGTPQIHWLQILVHEENGRKELLDFWKFGW